MTDFTNNDNTIDSRDVISRLMELEETEDRETWENEELESLQDLDSQGRNCFPNWSHGVTLIKDSYFEEYAIKLVEDIGANIDISQWPGNCIDWSLAAEQLQAEDYCTINFDGVDYWGM